MRKSTVLSLPLNLVFPALCNGTGSCYNARSVPAWNPFVEYTLDVRSLSIYMGSYSQHFIFFVTYE
jgi:hypothetical protein